MYRNIGKKIMGLASVIGVLSIVAGGCIALFGLQVLDGYRGGTIYLTILLTAFLVAVAGYISSWGLYALGQLVEDTHANRISLEKLVQNSGQIADDELPRL